MGFESFSERGFESYKTYFSLFNFLTKISLLPSQTLKNMHGSGSGI